MAPRGTHYIGFDPPVSPFVCPFQDNHDGQVASTVVTIDYDNATGELAATGAAARDALSQWAAFLVGDGEGGWNRVDVPVGDSTFATADLGVSTIAELNQAGFTAGR